MTQQPLSQFSSPAVARWVVRIVFAVLCVLVGLLGVGFVRMAWREHEINTMIAQQTALNDAQRERNKQLEADAQYRDSDAYAELAAREQLHMARPGETVLLPTMITPPQPAQAPQAAEPATHAADNTPNYERWWQSLFSPRDAGQ